MPRDIRSGERFFASDHPHVALPHRVQPLDEETEIQTEDVIQPQPVPAPDDVRPVVTIYVRKGDHPKERTVSINPIPSGADLYDLLHFGFALDGNSATISVNPYMAMGFLEGKLVLQDWGPNGALPGEWASTWSLTRAVNSVERAIYEWLEKEHGCEVKFG